MPPSAKLIFMGLRIVSMKELNRHKKCKVSYHLAFFETAVTQPAVPSNMKTFMNILIASQHQHGIPIRKTGIRIDRHIQLSIPLHSEDIDIVFTTDINISHGTSYPFPGYFHLKNSITVIQLNIIQNMIRRIANRCPVSQLSFRIHDLICTVTQKKF